MPQTDSNFKSENQISFEDALARLEELTALLENSDQGLRRMAEITEEIVRLTDFCNGELNALEEKAKLLTKDSPAGQTWRDFSADDDAE